jgi:Kef-type K+ transport system membrane component KefB
MHGLLHDIGIAVIAATILGLLSLFLRQPIILGYLIAGAVVGPQIGFGLVEQADSIQIISEIGLILLLFVIGLEMQLSKLLAEGKQLLIAGFGQFLVCAALGVGVFAFAGYGFRGTGEMDGLYLALVCGLSSTAIVVKLLYDKLELDTLAGRLTVGILIIQDIYAILILAFQPNFTNPQVWPIAQALGASGILLLTGFLFSKWILQPIFVKIAKSPELVVSTSLGWCALVAGVAGAMGLSKEMGALVAGLAISAFPYSMHVTAKTLPLRDFFLTLFFLSLGMKITMPRLDLLGPVLLVVGFVIVSRFASVYPLLKMSGAGQRTAFLTSLNLAQLSEFALVVAALGLSYGHITQDTMSILLYAMAITAVLSSYAIRASHRCFQGFAAFTALIGRKQHSEKQEDAAAVHYPIVVLGYHHGARALVDHLADQHPNILPQLCIVDYNPETIRVLKQRGIAATFGDLASSDSLEHAHVAHAEIILVTIPDMLLKGTNNQTIVKTCRLLAPTARIIAVADTGEQETKLLEAGATQVVRPHMLMGSAFAELIITQPTSA